ncbi:MAG: hypothetical protein MUF15_14140, partial [Acidobacteria bacterium]|nr:hypothetical protein [Acidobacteriota bacterium]
MKINFIVLSTIVIVNFFLGMHLMAVNENESPLFILTTRSEKFVTKEFIEHLYVSSDKTRLAFYLDSTRLIVILDFAQKLTTKTFYIPYESSVRDEGVLKFKTIRWNKAKDKCDTFIAVFIQVVKMAVLRHNEAFVLHGTFGTIGIAI